MLKRIVLIIIIMIFCAVTLAIGRRVEKDSEEYKQIAPGFYEEDPLPYKTVYLTFDDGPSDWTAEILDTLEKEGVKATFFVCAIWAPDETRLLNGFRKYRDVLIRMIKDGNVIGNHTTTHKNFAVMSDKEIARLLDDNQNLLNSELGEYSRQMTLIRTPKGAPYHGPFPKATRIRVARVLRKKGVVIMWSKHFDSTDSMEWVKGEWYTNGPRININDNAFKKKMKRIYDRLISRADGKGIVVLFHDTHPTSKEILKEVIDKLKSEGYTFATMEDYVQWRWHKSSADLLKEDARQ